MLFRVLELQRGFFQMFVAGDDMHLGPVDQGLVRPAQCFLQVAFGFLELALLQSAKPGLVALHRLCVPWIFGYWFLGGYLQWHQTAFSSELKSKSLQANARKSTHACQLTSDSIFYLKARDWRVPGGVRWTECLPSVLSAEQLAEKLRSKPVLGRARVYSCR